MEIGSDLLDSGVAKERVAMFKNLQSGAQSTTGAGGGDSKLRVDVSIVFLLSLFYEFSSSSDPMKLRCSLFH